MKTNSVIVNGGKKLKGTVSVQGSKNTTLPILASSLLFKNKIILRNVPDITDVRAMLDIMSHLGTKYSFENNVLKLDNSELTNNVISDEFTNKIRASSLLLGPLLSRFGRCGVGMPGGCSIGSRPLNFHFDGFEHLGANIFVKEGIVNAEGNSINGDYTLEFPSVGATQNLVNASIYNKESVILRNIAIEPEVISMLEFLNLGGADIEFIERNTIKINGIKELKPVEYQIPPDRIEAGTLLVAAFVTKGEVTLKGIKPEEISVIIQKLEDMGAKITNTEDKVTLKYNGEILGTNIRTGVHPAFPTDMQAQFSVLMTQASTNSRITETIFSNRFRHLDELMKLNANVEVEKNIAFIQPSKLSACRVQGYDLRGSASMVIAGLVAKGSTRVNELQYLYRGYESFIEKLRFLGAEIVYV